MPLEAQTLKTNKKLILIVVATLSSLCSTSYALEESLALMFAVTAARSFIATQPSIEVTSTEPVLLRGASALPLSDTQCMYTPPPEQTPEEQVCFGNNLPTRIELSPAAPLNIGFLPRATSQIEYRLLPALVTDPFFSGTGVLPELNPAFSIATEIQQSAERQRDIIEATRQRHQTFSLHSYCNSYYKSYGKGLDGLGEQGIEADGQSFEWWRLGEPESDTDDSDMAMVRDDDSILLEPGSHYWFFSNVNNRSQIRHQAATDGESGSEDASSGEDSKNEPEDEDKADPDSCVEITATSTDPLPVSKDVDESTSGDNTPVSMEIHEEITVETEAGSTACQSFTPPPAKKRKQTSSGSKDYLCPHPDCGRSYKTTKSLFDHQRRKHTGKKTCDMIIDGQLRPCGKVCRNAQALSNHKRIYHTRPRMYRRQEHHEIDPCTGQWL